MGFWTEQTLTKARKGPVDGDGDGWVYDGTPKKRPATPAEMEAGRRLRQQAKKAVGAKKTPAKAAAGAKGGKIAPAKDAYDKRVDRFLRAINQGARDPKKAKEVQNLIQQDFALNDKDRKDLTAVLAARRDGRPDPAPAAGSNRAKRGAAGGVEAPRKAAAKAAAKAPAKKAAAKRTDHGELRGEDGEPILPPKPKKGAVAQRREGQREIVGAKKAPAKKAQTPPPEKSFQLQGSMARAGEFAQQIKDAKHVREINEIRRKINVDPRLREVHRKVLREEARKREDALAAQASPKKAMDARKRVAAPKPSTTAHGPKTRAWQRLVQRDIKDALNEAALGSLRRQVDGLHKKGRISDRERDVLLKQIVDRAKEIKDRDNVGDMGRNPMPKKVRNPVDGRPTSPPQPKQKTPSLSERRKNWGRRTVKPLLDALRNPAGKTDFERKAQAVAGRNQHDPLTPGQVKRLASALKEGAPKAMREDREREAFNRYGKQIGEYQNDAKRLEVLRQRIRDDKDLNDKRAAILQDGIREHLDRLREAEEKAKKPETREPKAPGGRAKAKAKQDAVSRWRDSISDANNLDDIDNLMSALEKIPHSEIDKDDFNRIAEMLNDKAERLEIQNQEPTLKDHEIKVVVGGPGRPEKSRESNRATKDKFYWKKLDPAETEKTPAGRLLAKGKTIEEVEKGDPTGIAEYVHSHPDRFRITERSGGSGYAFTAFDMETGRNYFFKTTTNNGAVGMTGDAVNEYLAGALGNAAFGAFIPKVGYAGKPENDENPVIRMDHLDEMAKGLGLPNMEYDGIKADGAKISDPKNPLAIHIFDYLINQTDRHQGNYGVASDGQGNQVILPVDNGAAFRGYDGFVREQLHENGLADLFPDHFAVAPENVTYREWADYYGKNPPHMWLGKSRQMMQLAKKAYRAKGMDDDQMRADAEDILAEFQKVDLDAIIEDLHQRFPNMNKYEALHLQGAAEIWKRRLAGISANDVVRMVA